jgi:hypothetical protein
MHAAHFRNPSISVPGQPGMRKYSVSTSLQKNP